MNESPPYRNDLLDALLRLGRHCQRYHDGLAVYTAGDDAAADALHIVYKDFLREIKFIFEFMDKAEAAGRKAHTEEARREGGVH